MPKVRVSITISYDNRNYATENNINISELTDQMLDNLRLTPNDNLEGINIKLERIELEKAKNKLEYYTSFLKQTQERINQYEERSKQKEEEKLRMERERAENANKCISCKKILDNPEIKKHNFAKGIVCQACYSIAPASKIKEWMKVYTGDGEA